MGFPTPATDWSLDNWGEILIANPEGANSQVGDVEPGGQIPGRGAVADLAAATAA